MRRLILSAALATATLAAATFPAPAFAAPGGQIGTLPHGHYACELPGDALGPTGEAKPEFDFTVINSSSYRTPAGEGIYLLTGDRLVFTSGPFDGVKYHRAAKTMLRRTQPDGSDGDLRCVLGHAGNR